MLKPLPHNPKGYHAVDLDGTLAVYTTWVAVDEIGEPIPLMVQRVKAWLAAGEPVCIFTARVSPPNEDVAEAAIQRWCAKNIGTILPVTCIKTYDMIDIWDDRAIQVVPNKGIRVG